MDLTHTDDSNCDFYERWKDDDDDDDNDDSGDERQSKISWMMKIN